MVLNTKPVLHNRSLGQEKLITNLLVLQFKTENFHIPAEISISFNGMLRRYSL